MGVFTRKQDDVPPGLERAVALPLSAPRPLVAAAARMRVNDETELEKFKRRKGVSSWQKEAWIAFDEIGEVKYAFTLTGAVMSRVKIHVAAITKPSDPPSPIEDVAAVEPELVEIADVAVKHMRRLDSGFGGIPGLLREASINLGVTGECYLVQELPDEVKGLPERWNIRSIDEIEIDAGGKVSLQTSIAMGQKGQEPIRSSAFVGRMWRPHPRWHDTADSSMRALLGRCEELMLLDRAVRATAKSRLNAGALFIPDGLSVASSPDIISDEADDAEEAADSFEEELLAAMTTPITDEASASAVVPLLIRGPGELGSQIKQFKFERSFDSALADRADRVLERILQGIDMPKDIVTGMASVKYAASTDTEIMTRSGWKAYTDVQIGEDVYTLNHETGRGEWQPLLEINIHDHDGPMLLLESATHSSLTTPEHRWAIVKNGPKVKLGTERRWTTSAEGFAAIDRVETAAECGNLPIEPKYTDDFVRLVALYTSDGWMEIPGRGRPRANIAKTERNRNPEVLGVIRAILNGIDRGHREYESTSKTPNGEPCIAHRFRLSVDASQALFAVAEGVEKIVTFDFINSLTFAQLNLFLDALIAIGDGNLINGRMDIRRYWQTERARLEPIAMAAVLAGYTVRWLDKPQRSTGNPLVPNARPCWGLTVTKANRWFSPHAIKRHGGMSWKNYVGKVWCPTTLNHTWLARRSGKVFFTGNSNAVVINQSLFKAHIEPMTLLICDALTMMFMRPALAASGFSQEMVDRVVVWYDPSDILTSADRASSANEGWDRYLISGSTWRTAHGFAETDAPSGEELIKRIAVSRGQVAGELAESIYQQIAPDLLKQVREGNITGSKTPMPENLKQLLETGQMPAQPEGEPIPPEILEGLPLPGAPAEQPVTASVRRIRHA